MTTSDYITARLGLPTLAAGQAHKHITVNTALSRLDWLVHLSAIRIDDVPPTDPAAGDVYIIGSDPEGDWTGRQGQLASWEGRWHFVAPQTGWRCFDMDAQTVRTFRNGAWVEGEPPNRLAINQAEDPNHRLAVTSDSVLLDAESADARLLINRTDTSGVASCVFQSDYQGEAEFGLLSGAGFGLRVADNSGTWHDAFSVEGDGTLTYPQRPQIDGSLPLLESDPHVMRLRGPIPAAADLDTYTTTGLYYQRDNSQASSGTNYPSPALAGLLEVVDADNVIYQTYRLYSTAGASGDMVFRRGRVGSNWSAWKQG